MGQKDTPLLPAEWDKQQAVFINYSGNSDDAVTTEKVHVVCRDIIRELAAVTQVYVLINEEFRPDSLRQLFDANGIQTKNIYLLPVYRLFSMGVPRDYGPMVVKNRSGGNKIIRFGWDYVGADFINPDTIWSKRREVIRDRYFAQMKQLLKIEVESSPLVLEGGEIEVNGRGTAMLVDSFHLSRNPYLTKKQQEDLLASSLGVKKTIWLREGPAEDPGVGRKSKIIENVYGNGVGGHVDEFARFVNGNTIFLAMPSKAEAQADPIKKITYDRMKINEAILKKSGDQDGRPFHIVHIPVPDVIPETHRIDTTNFQFPISALRHDFPEWRHGDSIQFMPAISYLNFLIFNQLVLIPKYWRPGFSERCKEKDEEVRKIFASYFPDKKIVQIDTWGMNLVGGGIHCWTQQVPAD
ncbi:Agmatine deiminase [Dyadobacter sp. CECT 9623]|uniref:Agmatine deiminase n=1 Tax=Dyadobacter linearis TaxID=2823330 RepID=A0ABM8UVX4_9BACT|nr:agmatine deiminase family protein [Dyadobacter sp. CECT 9623]CAG5072975.1 Agmatine deiminase [Dyadobacter sp. CECT 9623]